MPATGRRATTSTREQQGVRSPTCRSCTRTGTAASRSAARSCATGSGSIGSVRSFGNASRRAPAVRQQERRRSDHVELRRGSQPPGAQRQRQEGRHDSPDGPGHAAQQAGLLLRLPEALYRARPTRRTASSAASAATTGSRSTGDSTPARPSRATCGTTARRSSQASWTSPVTNKLLLEAGLSSLNSRWGGQAPAGALMDFIPVVELVPHPGSGTPLPFYAYRAPWSFFGNLYGLDQQHNVWRASMAYVTGSHNLKVGYSAGYLVENQTRTAVNSGHPELPVLRRVPDPPHAADHQPRLEQPRALRRLLRAGSVDARPRHAPGRVALRAREELVPGDGDERHHWAPRGTTPRRSSFRANRRREGLQRPHAAHGRGLRRVRQRQDVAQGELQQVSAAGQQRERLHVGQPVGIVRRRAPTAAGSTPTATTWPTAI